jgi:ubiquitin-like modifier-activating enzyme ATG7
MHAGVTADYGAGGVPMAAGWEGNERGRAGARRADLGAAMDPRQLAESAVDLNLRLMKWRAAPELDIARLAAAKCLLLGAGNIPLLLCDTHWQCLSGSLGMQ